MSNSLAIAAVTATIQSILQQGVVSEADLVDTTVTLFPLDKARGNNTKNQLNLFLYQVARSAAWVNADMPRQVRPGEVGNPPLPLNLYYLVTAFGRNDDATQPYGHELLGKAMSLLHDHPLLTVDDIKAATDVALPDADLDGQIERVRITLHPVTVDDMSKLWTGFATQYRLSAAYEAAVALIESTRPTRAGLPILTRGPGDSGIASQADLTPPLPTLEELTPPGNQPTAKLGDVVTLSGFHLDGAVVRVQFEHPLWPAPIERPPEPGGSATTITVAIPNLPADWPAGFYKVSVLVQRPGENFRRATNQLALALAPTITIAPAAAPPGNLALTVTSAPEVRPEQRAALLFGSQEILADPHPAQTGTLTFAAANVGVGTYYVRLRVDGVDSQLVDRLASPPAFLATQKVVIA